MAHHPCTVITAGFALIHEKVQAFRVKFNPQQYTKSVNVGLFIFCPYLTFDMIANNLMNIKDIVSYPANSILSSYYWMIRTSTHPNEQ